jgi:hypothetical protein
MKHGERCKVCKRYWNSITNKWLKKPVRESTKGKAIGMTAGNAHREKLDEIKAKHPVRWLSHAYLPINLSVAKVEADAAVHWIDQKTEFEIDRALALSTLLINKSVNKVTTKENAMLHSLGFVGVMSSDLSEWVGCDYKRYIEFFHKARYTLCYSNNGESDFYRVDSHPKYYKFQQRHTTNANDVRKYHRVAYTTHRMLVKAFEKKEDRRQEQLQVQGRQVLVSNMYRIAASFDAEGFTAWCLSNSKKFRSDKSLQKHLHASEKLATGDLSVTPKDFKGERFHSEFTFRKKIIRDFARIDGEDVVEVDVKNSQFFFFACMVLFPDKTMKILARGMNPRKLQKVHDHLRDYYDNNPDVKEFIDSSLSGEIYSILITKFGGKLKKKAVKNICFRTLFSTKGECKKSKEKLRKHYPKVVEVCEFINTQARIKDGNEVYSIPLLLQRSESRTLLDLVAVSVANQGAGMFTTIHDSYLCKESDVPLFERVIEKTFKTIGLPKPTLSVEMKNGYDRGKIVRKNQKK